MLLSNSVLKKYFSLIFAVAAASFMVNLDTYIINVSIPAISADLGVSKADVSWVVLSYNLMVVSLLLICGKLADMIGVKKLFIGGFAFFTISSLLCALSQNIFQLVGARILQGIGASILYAMPQAMIAKFMPKEYRGKGFGFSASAAALGIMLGSPLSGLITGLASWHWIFLINLPVGLAVIFLILKDKSLVEEKQISSLNFDIKGSIISFLGVLGLTLWLNKINSLGLSNYGMIILLVVSLVLSGYFLIHCKKSENPLIDLNLFKNKYFSYANTAMFFISAFLAGNNFIMPFYLYQVKKMSEFEIGLIFIVYSVSYLIFSIVSGKISNKVSPEKVATIASFAVVFSILFFILNVDNSSMMYVLVFFVLLGISFSFFITSNNNYVMLQAKENNEGSLAGLHRMTGRFGMLFGVVLFEFIYSFVKTSDIVAYKITYVFAAVICLISAILSMLCLKKLFNSQVL